MAVLVAHVHVNLTGENIKMFAESVVEVAITGMRSVRESTTIKGSYQNIHRRHQQALATLGKITACLTDTQQEDLQQALSFVKQYQEQYLRLNSKVDKKERKMAISEYRDATIAFTKHVQMTSDAVAGDISIHGKNSAAYQLYVKCKEKSVDCEELVETINSTALNEIKSKKAKQGVKAKPKKGSKGEVQRKQEIERIASDLTSCMANYIGEFD